jgi:AraC-like DNA-binding protein/mannose-6-phosphate isomerase-like protein (cupin superfamily)
MKNGSAADGTENGLQKPIDFEENRSNQANYIYHQKDRNLNFPGHIHSSFEIFCLLDGAMEAVVNGRHHILGAGESIIILPYQIHSYKTLKASQSELIIFSCDLVPQYYKYVSGKEYADPIVRADVSGLMEKIQSGNNAYLNKGYAYELVGLIDSRCRLVEAAGINGGVLNAAIEYAKSHFAQKASLRELAAKSGYSYTYVSSLFNKNLLSFPKYVSMYRIELSAYFLSSTDMSITAIAFECGFSSTRSFNRAFRSLKGMTPSEYRKSGKN